MAASTIVRWSRRERWQILTTATLLVGYAGYYVCRSNLSVVAPELVREFGGSGVDRGGLGLIISAGTLAYAAGKALTGVLGDFLGGRHAFIGGMVASAVATIAFGLSGALPAFIAIWMANRFVQSIGWGSLVKIAAHWFPPARYGTVMGVLSLSFLFGDATGRFLLGSLMQRGVTWRLVFFAAAAVLGAIAAVTALTLRNSPSDVGLQEPPVSRGNVFGAAGASSKPDGLADLLGSFVRSPSFWAVAAISFALTIIREAFNAWTPMYLVDVYGLAQADAAQTSSLFPFIGGVSVLLVGRLSDGVAPNLRLAMTAPFLVLAVAALMLIGSRVAIESQPVGLVLLAAVAFLVIGPYSLLAGAMAVDLGARRGSATAAGLIDSAGYIGAALAGWGIGAVAERSGWTTAFQTLAGVAVMAVAATLVYCRLQRRAVDSVENQVNERPAPMQRPVSWRHGLRRISR